MNENYNTPGADRPEPWEQNCYQTGSTRPPKRFRGCAAVFLVALIFLGGIISALSLLNIRLFRQLQSGQEGNQMVLFQENAQDSTQDVSIPGGYDFILNESPESVENIPQEGGLPLQEIYTKAIDSVVSISCTLPGGSGSGTGVIFSQEGYVLTNHHVIDGASAITVRLSDDRTFSATVLGTDAVSDLAVLYISATELTAAEFGNSDVLRVGDAVVAIGDPLGAGLRGTMTDGIVSAINRDIGVNGRTMTLIQTNAALNAGNSGGPLLNCYGQVIGINTMKIGDTMSSAGVEGLGFAIPSTTVKEVVDQLLSQGYVSGRPRLGFSGQGISSFDQMFYRLPAGIYITNVEENSTAAEAGIAAGDVLLSFAGNRVYDMDTLNALLYAHKPGEQVDVVLYRAGRQQTVKLEIGEAN